MDRLQVAADRRQQKPLLRHFGQFLKELVIQIRIRGNGQDHPVATLLFEDVNRDDVSNPYEFRPDLRIRVPLVLGLRLRQPGGNDGGARTRRIGSLSIEIHRDEPNVALLGPLPAGILEDVLTDRNEFLFPVETALKVR